MQNYFKRSCYKMLLIGMVIASCQGAKYHVKRKLPPALLHATIGYIPTRWLRSIGPVNSVNKEFQVWKEDSKGYKEIIEVLKQYSPTKPYEIYGDSQELLQNIDYVIKFGIPYVRYHVRDDNFRSELLTRQYITRLLGLPFIKSLEVIDSDGSIVTELHLSECKLDNDKLRLCLGRFKHHGQLRSLNLHSNELSTCKGLENLPQLEDLNLTDNQFTTLEGLKDLPKLKSLDLCHNKFSTFKGLENLPQLEHLNLNDNQLTTVEGLKNFPELQILTLGNNKLCTFKGLENLPQLENLNLNDNQLTTVEGLENLPKLERLYLNRNQLSTVEGLKAFPELKELSLRNNKLCTFKGSKNLPKLVYLQLGYNQLKTVEGLENFPELEWLNLSRNTFLLNLEELKEKHPGVEIFS